MEQKKHGLLLRVEGPVAAESVPRKMGDPFSGSKHFAPGRK